MTQKVAQHKKDRVKEFTELINQYSIVGVVNMQNLPTKQLQTMRENLRGKVLLRMTKRRFLNIALDNSTKEGIKELKTHMKGMPALLFTNDNPFSLFSTLKKNKSKAPINAGQIAPNDIVVPAGKTSFAPGPVIGELGGFGIKTAVEDGKITIKEDKVVAKEGEVVNGQLAGLLTRLGVEPMEIGLDLVAVYENKEILTKEVLDIDEEQYTKDFQSAALMAFNLAVEVGFPTSETVIVLIQKAAADSKALAIETNILTDETVGIVFSKAESEASSLKSQLNLPEVAETTSESVKEEAKPEAESKEEVSETKAEANGEVVSEENKEEAKPELESKGKSPAKEEAQTTSDSKEES